jgi:hypothetical protein
MEAGFPPELATSPLFASMNEGPLSSPVLRRDGAWLREVSPDGMDAGGAPAGRAGSMARGWVGDGVEQCPCLYRFI